MKKKLLFPCLLLTAAMLFACVFALGVSAATVTMTDVAAGTATPAAGDIVTISDEAELKAFSQYVSDGGATEGITFRLESDIALTLNPTKHQGQYLTNLNPIGGVYNGAAAPVAFKGIFDGNGKTVSNLVITNKYVDSTGANKGANNSLTGYCGLFATIDGGTVKDLTVKVNQIVQVGTDGAYGVITGYATNASIINTMVLAEVEGDTQITNTKNTSTAIGGLVGYAADSVIDGCTVKITIKGYAIVAAIVGQAEDSVIRNCVAGGSYTNTQSSILGGVAGEISGTTVVANCYSSAALSGKTTLGGIVGVVGEGASVQNCFSDASVSTGAMLTYGVLVGENNGTVEHSFGLRAADKGRFDAHADIGVNNGEVASIYAYMVEVDGDTTAFVVGTVTVTPSELPCSPEINASSSCAEGAVDEGCSACSGRGFLKMTVYEFVPSEDSAIANLADALNAWVAETSTDDVAYANWVVNGNTIVNCKHNTTKYVAYEGKAPNCVNSGEGDLLCAFCEKLIEEGVTIPADPDAHTSPDGKYYTCVAYDCVVCQAHVDASVGHIVDTKYPCKDQTCTRCHNVVPATTAHTKPADFDESKPCAEYVCTECSTKTHDVEHDAPAASAPCKSASCSVCGLVVHAASRPHAAGLAPTCTKGQYCLDCGEEINPPRGHAWGDPATCGSAQLCTVCNEPNPDAPATGDHTPNMDAPTCLEHVQCTVCKRLLDYAKGHKFDADAEIDCGHGKSCTVCYTVVESATGEHNIDWTAAEVIRPATPERTGIVIGVCEDCGREFEGYTTYAVQAGDGKATISGVGVILYTGGSVDVSFKKVADYKTVTLAEGYLPLQVVEIGVLDILGDEVDVGKATVTVILNKSAAKMALANLKLYQVKDGVASEIAITEMADGYITFTADALGTFLLAAESTAAFSILGSLPVQTQQTAALVGTFAFEKRDDEI